MKKSVKAISLLLTILLMISMLTGCGSREPAADTAPNTTEAPAEEPVAEELAAEAETKETVTIYAYVPVDWYDVYVWAWKDGGESVFGDEGTAMEMGPYGFILQLPGWVDRLAFGSEPGAAQTAEVVIEPGKDLDICIFDDFTVEVFDHIDIDHEDIEYVDPNADDPMFQAAQMGDFETVKSMLPTLEDRSILTDWAFNDFNNAYAVEAVLNGDYETAIEFFGYCAFEGDRDNAVFIRQLVDGDREAAIDTLSAMEFTGLDRDLGMSWAEIILMVTGADAEPGDIDCVLMEEYLRKRLRGAQTEFPEGFMAFGDNSTWEAEGYVSEVAGDEYLYIPVDDLNGLYSRCGSEANGKVLVLRSQKAYPSGKTVYSIDKLSMSYLGCELYPASLSEVEYIILAEYSHDNEGQYKQTFSGGEASVVDYFYFLRMKGRVNLLDATGGMIEQTQWLYGTGEVEAHFSDDDFQCSNMPETGVLIIDTVETVRQLNS